MAFNVLHLQEDACSEKVESRNEMAVLTAEENGVVVTPIKGKAVPESFVEGAANLKARTKEVQARNIVHKD